MEEAPIKITSPLVQIVEQSGLEKNKAQFILEKFQDFFKLAADWEIKAKTLIVTSEEQTAEMAMARQGRLFLKNKRNEVEKARKELKEQSLREGKTIDSIATILKNLIEPIEDYLDNQENFIEIQSAKKRVEITAIREIEIQPLLEYLPFAIDVGSLSEEDYVKICNGAKLQLQAKIELEQRQEKERIQNERISNLHNERKESILHLWQFAEEELKTANLGEISENVWDNIITSLNGEKDDYDKEQEELKIENERLKKESEIQSKALAEQEAKADAERKAIAAEAAKIKAVNDAKLKKEQEEKTKLQAQLKAKQDAETAAKKEAEIKEKTRIAEEKKLAKQPDKDKLNRWISNLYIGDAGVTTNEASKIQDAITEKFELFIQWAKKQIETL